eukprot:TRINITY_DN7068_c0_g1_i1.p1 TRINITY_DN7068_c0_g1~~TRINITY_DN7068_c0_g1_i1.p1  ORF type:complete len:618 (-),score=129.05 TRINITY_DN7068_c0_g1_i1:35-1888(-)
MENLEVFWSLALILTTSLLFFFKRGFEWYSFHYRCNFPASDHDAKMKTSNSSDEDTRCSSSLNDRTTRKLLTRVPGLYPRFPDLSIDTQREHAQEYRERFGDVYFVWNIFQPIVVLSDPQAVSDYFASQRSHTREFGEVLGYGFSDIMGLMLGASDGSRYQRLHPLFAPFYREIHVANDLELIWNTVHKFFRRYLVPISASSASPPSSSSSLQLDLGKARFDQLPLTILVKLAFGEDATEETLQRVFDLYENHSTLLMECMRNPLTRIAVYRRVPTATNRKIQRHRSDWRHFCEEKLQELRQQQSQQQSHPHKDRSDLFYVLGTKLLKEEEEEAAARRGHGSGDEKEGKNKRGASLSWEELWHTLYEVTIFNIDITISELTHHLNNLAKHRHWQDRLRQQIERVLPPSSVAAAATTPSMAQLNALTLLDAFILETARLSPAVELSFPERLTEDQTLGDFHFPKGTCLCVDAVALNTHVASWGSDAKEFKPERFLGNDEKTDEGATKRTPSSSSRTTDKKDQTKMMHRFGLGARRCMGYRYANVMIKCVLVHILQNYDVALTTSTPTASASSASGSVAMKEGGEMTARVMIPMLSPYAISSLLTFTPLDQGQPPQTDC